MNTKDLAYSTALAIVEAITNTQENVLRKIKFSPTILDADGNDIQKALKDIEPKFRKDISDTVRKRDK